MIQVKKNTIFSLVCLLIVSVVLMLAFAILIPSLLEKTVLSYIKSNAGISGFEWQVRRIGFSGADFGGIKFGEKELSAFSAPAIQIDYDLLGLFNRRLKQVRISGVDINFKTENGMIAFPGIDMEQLLKKEAADQKDSKRDGGPPVFVEKIVFDNAFLNGDFNDNRLSVPLDISFFPKDKNYETIQINALLYPPGQIMKIEAAFEKKMERLKFSFDTKNLNLATLSEIFTPTSNIDAEGAVDLNADAVIDLAPFEIISARVLVESENFAFSAGPLNFGNLFGEKGPFRLNLKGGGDSWNFWASGLSIRSGVGVNVEEFDGTFRIVENFVMSTFLTTAEIDTPKKNDLKIEPSLRRRWKGEARIVENAKWSFEIENYPADDADNAIGSGWHRVRTAALESRILLPPLEITGMGDLKEGSASAELKASDIHMDSGSVSVKLPLMLCDAEIAVPKDGKKEVENKDETRELKFLIRLSDATIRSAATNMNFSGISLSGKIPDLDADTKKVGAVFEISDGSATNAAYKAAAKNINMKIPMIWPPSGKSEPGSLSMTNLSFYGKKLGKISADIRQDGFAGIVDGAYTSDLIKGLTLQFKGVVENSREGLTGRLDFNVDDFRFGPGFKPGDFIPKAKGVVLDGKFALDGDFSFKGPKMESSAKIKIDNARIASEEQAAVMEGVQMELKISDLLNLQSPPHQQISFESATMGNIKVNEGNVFFRVDSPDSFFVEKTNFKWCDGNVETNAMRIDIPFEELVFTLYCDRLDLAGVLRQLGGVEGEGKGEVNGRIPVRYENSSFKFDDGFLYSTPGEGGTVRLTGTDVLMTGIPAGTAQFAQVDLAREALKDYDYEWAKINIDTKDENLHVNLKLEGQPAGPLPFRYDREFGGFARVEADSPGSRFQGIRLDVNFTLPLNEVLKYGMGLKGVLDLDN